MKTTFELENGRCRVALTETGAGLSSWGNLALNRWAGHSVGNAQGLFLYLRDLASGQLWAATPEPVTAGQAEHDVTASADGVEFVCTAYGIVSELHVSLADEVETRWLRLRNVSECKRSIQVTSYLEVALADRMADLSHPAFSKLFVQTAYLPERGCLMAARRARSSNETFPMLLHGLSGGKVEAWETDREQFIGRGNSAATPQMRLTGTVGNVLDPCMALQTKVELQPGESAELVYTLHASEELMPQEEVAGRAHDELDPGSYGEFSEDGLEYVITRKPPMPWCNVLANERFGCLVTDSGAGCTWSRNSQANRLTPWSNDPVSDPHGEWLLLKDTETEESWSVFPGPKPSDQPYRMTHGMGYSRCELLVSGLEQEVTVFVPRSQPVKITLLRVTNRSAVARRLEVHAGQQLVLGSLPSADLQLSQVEDGTCLATNPNNPVFSDGTTFCFARFSDQVKPELIRGVCEGSTFEQAWRLELGVGAEVEMAVVLGEAVGADELAYLRLLYGSLDSARAALAGVKSFWRELTGRLQVKTPAREMDLMVNGWLVYQILSSRLWARTAFYQSSGAYGFRDQLQDAGNLLLLCPNMTREQILLHARHQFAEGDVLHWWHGAPVYRGLRTRFADDLLWLPFVACEYVRSTGDEGLWNCLVSFAEAPLLPPHEMESYTAFSASTESASLYEHCCRALDRSLHVGLHGLPLMGAGDWNDGMNRVGHGGKGESVWLGFFLHFILKRFAEVSRARHDGARAERYLKHCADLELALNAAGWDGAWFRRAYYDDGTALGSKGGQECKIDGLVQAWAALAKGATSQQRAVQSLAAAEFHLVDENAGVVHLLTPPFQDCAEDPGYIKGYVAGVRENGGQYTHAACWMVQAAAELGWRETAAKWWCMLSPVSHTRTAADIRRYKVEPYVIAADVYGCAPHEGRGGWTWYTGSAGWAYRSAVESILGLRLEGGKTLVLRPCIPDEWPGFHISYQPPGYACRYEIEVTNPGRHSASVCAAFCDGSKLVVADGEMRLALHEDAGAHVITVELG